MNAPAILKNRPRVLVTRRWPESVEAQLAERFDTVFNVDDTPMTPAEFRDALTRFDAILPTVTDRLTTEAFDISSPKTRLLANYGVGFSHIDIAAAKAHGIAVTNTPDVLSECTADLAMTLLLMVARRAGEGERELRAGQWTGWRPTHLVGSKVSGKTLGIVGFGRIGQAMAQRAHFGFGMKILVQNRSRVAQEVLDRYQAVQVDTLDDLLPACDFVSMHCPGGAENRHLINSRRLDLMKSDAFLINTARGEVVDENALVQSLTYECIAGAGLDVFDGEPKVSPALMEFDNLVLLPHLGSATAETRTAMGERVLSNVIAFFEGSTPADRVA
ncbi:D-glycerate dehydrogenase [Roseobacter denitrificans]|uniref:Glyoxylate reductase n=1 Tax=Roseobacter denitrificans (strain ATCC 33942 / OCh 114) TaxID=375451 RepID=Q160B1_ROSDO|nr:D-glycerate dehydrogenase [Roseobacter denitrificans]ABG33682.1 glyoxylate reductase [Roseobacter denitrificans OCh 114]AVL54885.1 D-glycerate dehydrogenase [Roseobacter denitrificans]